MYKINDLIEFLRLDRRYEEADEKNQEIDQNKVSITVLDTNEIRVIDRKEFENFNLYNRIFNLLDTFNPTHFYVLSLGEKRVFYIKTPITNDGYNYLNLETKKAEIVENEELLHPIELDFQTNHYFYDKEKREVVISAENLKEVTIFDDKIFFDPKKLDLETDTYTYNYSKPISTFCQFINGIIDFVKIVISALVLSIDKKKDAKITVKHKGTIFLIPSIYVVGDNYYLWYYYTSSSKKPFYEVNEEDAALKLEFKGKEPFLCFLNETIFTQENFNYLDAYGKKRRIDFIEEFKQKIIEPLERDINNYGYQSFYNAMITLYYLTDTIVLTLSNETLWRLFEEGISRNSLTNKLSLEEENIFVKLLEAIANKETTQEAFLSRLLRKKDEKTTYLEFLYNRIHGENGTTFANLVNKAWKQSRFIAPDTKQNKEFINTDGPLLLPYESEKHLGFYFSNASVSFNEENQIAVSFETGQFKETISTQSRVAVPYMKEVIAHYNYHPFYPIFLKNIEKQETELKLDAVVPAFVLMANANQQFWHNIIKTGEYALDALSIYTGFGALAEFRYLKTLTQLAVEAKEVSTATKIARAANILANVKAASGVVQITSGSVNIMLKLTSLQDQPGWQELSRVLYFLELITLTGELTIPLKNGLKKAAKEAIENSGASLRKANRELFDELYKITGLDELGRKIIKIANVEDIGKQGNKVIFKLIDEEGNEIGQLIRTTSRTGRELIFEIEKTKNTVSLINKNIGKTFDLPVEVAQEIVFADLKLPATFTEKYSGLGEIILDDAFAFYKNNSKFEKVNGIFGLWLKDIKMYEKYGGQSINLTQFWKAVDEGKSYEEAAFETFTGKWARKNGFTKAVIRNKKEDVKLENVLIKFVKG